MSRRLFIAETQFLVNEGKEGEKDINAEKI